MEGRCGQMVEGLTMTGAQFEIRIDGTPRSYRDRKDYAMEAARLIKSKNPHSMVEVKDLKSGDVTAVALRPGEPIYLAFFYDAQLDQKAMD
jgi:hypothetical protein